MITHGSFSGHFRVETGFHQTITVAPANSSGVSTSDGGDGRLPRPLSLAFDAGKESREIATLQGGEIRGTGSAAVTQLGTGGRIVGDGADAGGVPIRMTVGCAAFVGIEAEGG